MSVKKRGLGKGLSALIPDEPLLDFSTNEDVNDKILLVDIFLIEPNRDQPRREFDKDSLNELVESIKAHGILQPIIVKKTDMGYEIVAGERRWRAAREAGLKQVPALVKELSQIESSQIALIENIQREDLNPIEEAFAYKNLSEKYKLTQEEISQAIGKSRPYIANTMRLLNLDEEVINLIVKGDISSGHGRALLSIEDKEIRLKLCKTIIENNLNVRETEKLVKDILNKKNKDNTNVKAKERLKKDPTILEIEESLRKILGTKVLISKGSNKGKIEIEYYNDDDLDRILEILSK